MSDTGFHVLKWIQWFALDEDVSGFCVQFELLCERKLNVDHTGKVGKQLSSAVLY